MKITIKSKYLVFPVNTLAANKILSFHCAGQCLYTLKVRLDNHHPNFFSYIDVSRFGGQTLELTTAPEMDIIFREANEMDMANIYQEDWRPQLHFSTKNGWLNDPNGLIFLNGKYHLFYQYNPAEPQFGNCHWGHAVSNDLFRWKELPIALFPDCRGIMASGSAIVDHKNLLGKNIGNNKAAVLFYTTNMPCCQNISYSTDDFQTIHHFSGNPIIPHIEAKNRDPKVIWCEELESYVMALYMQKGDYCLFRSDNLVNWQEITRIHFDGEREVPDFFPLTDENGERFWILMGCIDRYLVGKFTGGKFVPIQPVKALHHAFAAYAGQTFSNMPDGRIVRITWQRWSLPVINFNGQMSVPMELSLQKIKDTHYVKALPVNEINSLITASAHYPNISVSHTRDFQTDLHDAPLLLHFCSKMPKSGSLLCTVFGRTFCLDFTNRELRMADYRAPLSISGGDLDLTVVVDRCSFELFADGGTSYMSIVQHAVVCDRSQCFLLLQSDTDLRLDKLEVHTLDSIWNIHRLERPENEKVSDS